MASTKIIIDFLRMPTEGEEIRFNDEDKKIFLTETFKKNRTKKGETAIPSRWSYSRDYYGTVPENYAKAFSEDCDNYIENYNVERINHGVLGTVIITTKYPYAEFGQGYVYSSQGSADYNLPKLADITVVNGFNIDVGFERASSPDTHIRVNVISDERIGELVSPHFDNQTYMGSKFPVAHFDKNTLYTLSDYPDGNVRCFEWIRGDTILVEVRPNASTYGKPNELKTVVLPKLLNAGNFNVTSLNSPVGATVTIKNVNSEGLELQYSLDNIAWQDSNVFSGLNSGNFTLYVRDQYGGEISKAFSVSEFNINKPYFFISKSNSIRYAKRIKFGTASNYKNDENTLSCEVDVPLAYTEIQQFQSSDSITTQFKSNYAKNEVVVIRPDGSEVPVPVIKRSSNIGLKEARDARRYSLGDGKTGIYFLSGKIYGFDIHNSKIEYNSTVGPYSLNGSLPFWAQPKKYVIVNYDWFEIKEIIFDESKNAEVIVVEDDYSGYETDVFAGSIYNLFDYEIYEYTVNMGDFINENIRVRLNNTDAKFGSVVHLSEMINVKERQEKTIEIKYKNTDNTDIFYGTGIEHKIRQQYQKISGFKEDPSENYKTDTNAILLSAEIYEGDEFLFEPVTKEMMRKIIRALSHKIVYIDEVGYCKNGDIEVEGPLEQSNLYVVKAKMIKNGNIYNANSASGDDDKIYNGESFEVIGLVNSGAGFMRI